MRVWLISVAIIASSATTTACRSDDGEEPARVSTRAVVVPTDAAPARPTAPQPAAPDVGAEPEGWLDPMPHSAESWHTQPSARSARPARSVQLVIRSTPPGASVMIDGENVGVTPTFWEGEVTRESRDFVFILPGYAIGRYRFVATHDSIVHPTLKKLVKEVALDAGAP